MPFVAPILAALGFAAPEIVAIVTALGVAIAIIRVWHLLRRAAS